MIKKILGTIGKSVVSGGSFEIPAHDSPLFAKIDWEKLPRHVAVIMDGNGRWAKGQGMLRTAGHTAGVKTLKNILCKLLNSLITHICTKPISIKTYFVHTDKTDC